MLYDLFASARGFSTLVMAGVVIWLLLSVIAWVRLGGRGVRRDGDQVLTPLQILSRVGLELYGVGAGFYVYVGVIGERALALPGVVQSAVQIPASMIDQFIPASVVVDRNLLLLHSVSAVGFAVFVGFILHNQLRPASFVYEMVDRMRMPLHPRGSAGSSHFCTVGEYRRYFRSAEHGLTLIGAFWGQKVGDKFGRLDRGQGAFCLSEEDAARGILVLGAPGAGKTQGLILPTIADRMRQKQSLIVVDPQGELRAYVLKLAALTGHRVAVHDPTDPASPRFNLAQGIKDVSDARAIAEVLIPFSANADDRFWSDSAANLLAASLMRFTDLGSIYHALSDLKRFAAALSSEDDGAFTLAGSFVSSVNTDARLATNIAATLSTALAGWADKTVAENTRSSDISAFMLNEAAIPTVIVLTCPGRTRAIYAPYLGATLRKLMIDLDSMGEQSRSGMLLNGVSIVIDEFPQLGRISSIVADVNLVRKRNLSILLAAQTLSQIQVLYGIQGTQSLLTGLATQIVFGGCDMATADYYSKTSGLTTEHITKRGEDGMRVEVAQRQRALLTPDEIQSPPRGVSTIFSRFVEEGYAAQVVVLAEVTRFYQRRDWNAFFSSSPLKAFELVGKVAPKGEEPVVPARRGVDRLPVRAGGVVVRSRVMKVRKHEGVAS